MSDRPIEPNGFSSAAKQAQRGSVLREKTQQVRTISPLSYNQRGLWTIHQNNPDGAAYHVAFATRIVSHIRVAALRKAFQSIVDRHPALRTTFTLANGEPVQVIHAAQEVAFEERAVDGKAVDAEVRRDYERPFDLEAGPLMRVTLFRIEPERSVLLVNIHHLVFDGWSLWILLSELGELYEAASGEGELPPQQIRHTYEDFVRWQADLLESERGQQLWNFWRERLSGELPVLDLPTDRPRHIVQATRGSTHLFDLSSGLTDEWKRFSRQESATPFHTLLAAWSVLLYRYTGQTDIVVGVPMTGTARGLDAFLKVAGCFVNTVPVRIDLSGNPGFRVLLARVRSALLGALEHQDYPFPLLVERLKIARDHGRSPVFQVAMIYQKPQADSRLMDLLVPSAVQRSVNLGGLLLEPYQLAQQEGQFDITLEVLEYEGLACALKYDRDLFEPATVERLAQHYRTLLESILEDADKPIGELAILPEQERAALLADAHLAADDSQREQCVHQTYEARAARVPDEIALVCGNREITFGDLNTQANGLARRLESLGVRPDVPVGICASRSIEMVTGMLAILKAGGAYVPLDPSFPEDRLAWMIEDSGIRVVLTESALQQQVRDCGANIVLLGEHTCGEQLDTDVRPCHLAYVIYTSGSTGRPKGVMVEHRQVSNFFSAMDARLAPRPPATFLAVTTISFDISVLEIFWALTRGFKVVLQGDARDYFSKTSEMAAKPLEFSLFYFANEGAGAARDRYRLLLEGAKFADVHGFSAVWTPERHFHSFGGLYPNPSVAGAALAAATERIHIRAGSVVLPLHSPIRVAEEWSVVDNLSDGRVGLSFANGWNSNDFVLAPQNYEHRKLALTKGIETVRRLWRGETIEFPDHQGNAIAVQTLPRPIQAELPFWLTSAGDPEMIQNAGRIGANLLTHLLGQSFEQLEKSIALYRQARREAGHPGDGHVTLMLHTFVGTDLDAVRETVRKPFCDYLRSSTGLMSNMARSVGIDATLDQFSEGDWDALLSRAFDRYFGTSGLFGTPHSCLEVVDKLQLLGVDELACLIDFGVDSDIVLDSLKHLDDLRRAVSERSGTECDRLSIAAQIRRHNVTHFQCTPSLARMMLADPETREALKTLQILLVGGEALPFDLACSLREAVGGLVFNMYGPTETTIWSSVWNLSNLEDRVSVGTPIANTQFYVLSEHGQLVPLGVSGELHIGGKGIARGYWKRPELTSERFMADPFRNATNARLYRTGDLARRLASGDVEILGRIDSQTKIRGFRIELGEIETALNEAAEVAESVAVVQEDEAGDRRLAAYIRLVEPIVVPTLQVNEAVKATSDPARLIELPNGLEVFHHDAHQTHGIADEVFTNHDYLQNGITYYDGDCIFDVGMNIGLFALFAHQQCQNPVVYGFEPIPPTFDIARRNFELYSLDVRLFNCALSDEEGTARFTFYPQMSGLSSQFGDPKADIDEAKSMFFHLLDHNEHDERRQKTAVPDLRDLDALMQARYSTVHFDCPLRTLSSVIDDNGIDRIDLLKIDVEKAEGHVLRGIRQEHWARIRQMVVEVHSTALLQEVTGLLSTHHFKFFIRDLFRIPPADGRAPVDIFLVYAFNAEMAPRCATQRMGADALTMQLRQRLKEKLPSYMVPGEIHLVPEIPRTPNGKVDRAVLALDRKCGRRTRAARVEPRTETERKMASMWTRLLNAPGVGIYDNFFELGGHSLLATQLLFMIRDELGVNVSLQTLMQQDTIAALAESIDKLSVTTGDVNILASLDKVAGEPLFPLTSYGGKNLFLVPGTTGNPLAYRPLAKYLEGKIRLFGCITHHVLDFDHGSIEAMASELIRSVSRLHPVGPVHLAGHSFGAVVVFEMARQLTAQGRTVGSLTLIDLPAPGSADFRFRVRDDIDWLVDIGNMVGIFSGKNLLLERQALEKLERREQLQLVLRQFQQEKIASESAGLDLIETLLKTHRRSLDILLAYQAVYCDVDLVVIHGNSSSSGEDGALGWSGLTRGKVRAVKVAGDHFSMIAEPYVRELAAELINILA